MNLGLKITWSSAKPSVAYLRLLGALRFHSLPLILPVLPPRPGIAQSGAVGGVELTPSDLLLTSRFLCCGPRPGPGHWPASKIKDLAGPWRGWPGVAGSGRGHWPGDFRGGVCGGGVGEGKGRGVRGVANKPKQEAEGGGWGSE